MSYEKARENVGHGAGNGKSRWCKREFAKIGAKVARRATDRKIKNQKDGE